MQENTAQKYESIKDESTKLKMLHRKMCKHARGKSSGGMFN